MGFQSSINQMINVAAAARTAKDIKEPLTEGAKYLKEKYNMSDEEASQQSQRFESLAQEMGPEYQKLDEVFRKAEASKNVAQERASRNIKNRPQKGVPTLNINDLRIVGGKK